MRPDELPKTGLEISRIAVVGTTGSGKSTLAERLARKLDIPFVELDALFWEPNWHAVSFELFCERAEDALRANAWTTAGNYSFAREIIWGRADTLIWLDYPLRIVMTRLFKRTLHRLVTRQELWNGNRDSWRRQFLSRNSLFLYAYKTHERWRWTIPLALNYAEYEHLELIHFTHPKQADDWLAALPNAN